MTTTLPPLLAGGEPAPPTRRFEQLREDGLRLLQQLGGARWTDHNLHDPGITLLEQLCFALTDLEYRIDFPVADHLSGADGRIDYPGLSLHPPAEVFPCRATTAEDYRHVLLDAVPGLADATLEPTGLPGVSRIMLRLAPGDEPTPAVRVAAARAAWRRERNLCEDVADDIALVRDVDVELVGDIEIAGPRAAVEVLAEAYDRCARFVAREPRRIGLEQALREGRSLEEIFTGPRVANGWIAPAEGPAAGAAVLFLADLAAIVGAVDGVAAARLRALRSPATPGRDLVSLAWAGPGWALRLQVPDGRPGFAPLGVTRRASESAVDLEALRQRYADLQAAERMHRQRVARPAAQAAAALLPRGTHRPPIGYRSVQHDFPATYGLARHGLPASAGAEERARRLQFKAYLRLFDQALADSAAQIDHLATLFSLDGGSVRSYWHQDVDSGDRLPGDGVLGTPVDRVLDQVHAPFDRSADRKSRALDHLLALHGVTLRQDGMRQFGAHLEPEEQDAWLLANKAAFLRDVLALGRDRAGSYDDARSSWEEPTNCAGLQRRASLLLGFRLAHDRSLTRSLQRRHLPVADADPDDAPVAAAPPQARRIPRTAAAPDHDAWRADLAQLSALRAGVLAGAMLRAGVRRDRYALQPAHAGRSGAHTLLLGPDENGRWRTLGQFATEADAARAADSACRFLRLLNDESEGLHVVEHVLLRRLGRGADEPGPFDDPGFLALRLTVVLPAWTARTRDPAFRRFAAQTLRMNCPAHLAIACLWLDFDAMARFEDDFAQWMAARAARCRVLDEDGRDLDTCTDALDRVARKLAAHLLPAWTTTLPDDEEGLGGAGNVR